MEAEAIDPSMKFLRNGLVGAHRKELSVEFLEKVDAWEKGFLGEYGLSLDDILFS